jgi:DNA polymerase I
MGYARSRWYSRECAASVTAFGRQYIQKAIADAEANGFKVVYGDTDSVILLLGNNTKERALAFMKGFNESLPKNMELELEDFYKRGVFVGKKAQNAHESGAKKKYALITEDGRIKIRGFELVRRDWSKIARDTQRRVLETILQEGDTEKAVNIVKEVVSRLREGKVPLSDLAISTQLRKSTKNYDSKSPELSAAQKAIQQGLKRSDEIEHSVISYVITGHGGSISDKAVLEEFAKDYDPDYYINNQVIPATMRILKELNFNEDELKGLGKQSKLL